MEQQNENNSGTIPQPERSYADMVLDTMRAARESVERAVAHYEEQRRELTGEYERRCAEIDEHVAALRASLVPAPADTNKPARLTDRKKDRLMRLLQSRRGPVPVREAARLLQESNAALNAEARRCRDLFRVTKTDDGVMVSLREDVPAA